ncbi:MAG: glycosyltransferase, partial [Pseudomonadales bacterium]|nr:glycosyltransferase [Pseudomonadales bacterium]
QEELRKVDSARIEFLEENKKLEAVRLEYQNEQVIERERYQSVQEELRKVDSARIEFLEENKKLEAVRLEYQAENNKLEAVRLEYQAENNKLEAVRLEYQAENNKLIKALKSLQDHGKKLEDIGSVQQAEIVTLKDVRDSLNEDVIRLEGINESQGITIEELRSEQFKNKQALEEFKGVLRDIRGENKILYQDIALLSAEQNRIRHSLDEILKSTSWKLSAPIRMVGGGVKTIRDLFFLIGLILRSASNARELIYKGKTAISNHGLLAVLSRFSEYARYARRSMSARGPSKVNAPAQGEEQRFYPDLNEIAEIETIDSDVSIVIPTFNAGDEFYWLLRKLRQQEGFGDLQIIVVDSGSTDDTVDLARDAGCVVIEIPQEDFSHSYSRNLGADSAKSEYLLFIVQDAYPIGDRWLYGMLSYVRDHADERVMAVSCAEFCRGDSDVMYDCNVDTHYRFLGCLEYDSIGEYRADDHVSLRSEGQLSDISCLIPRNVFEKYRYLGDYAEDLDLGIRLIRNNNKIAMLASVKTIHSHNRPSYYYLKRSFVDVIFLVRQFEDFEIPRNLTFNGLFDSIVNIAGAMSRFMGQFETDYCGQTLKEVLDGARIDLHTLISHRKPSGILDLQDDRFTAHLEQFRTDYIQPDGELSEADQTTARALADGFLARLDHFANFSGEIYREQDEVLREEILQMFGKTFAATVGSYIGFLYLNRESLDPKQAREIEAVCLDLQAGI